MNQKCLSTLFMPVQQLKLNFNSLSVCPIHQKPMSYYNKYMPENEPICGDCLFIQAKEGKNSNLFVPSSNLEQEYYYQKNAFFQIIEQANNIKKYEAHIKFFQNLLTNYFSQFISKFLKEKINVKNDELKRLELGAKAECMNVKDVMSLLNRVEKEKYILENKSADVFFQLNKYHLILLKNHHKLEEAFKNMLYNFFGESTNGSSNMQDNEKSKELMLCKTQSNKKNPKYAKFHDIPFKSNISMPSDSSKKNHDFMNINNNLYKEEKFSHFSPNEDLRIDLNSKIKEITSFGSSNINRNMAQEKMFEEKEDMEPEKNKKDDEDYFSPVKTEQNEKENSEGKKENDLEWRRKNDDKDEIYLEHKKMINQLIEKDKNKKSNHSFYRPKKKSFKKNHNSNKFYNNKHNNSSKFTHPKKVEYKQYNQFSQKNCRKCGDLFSSLKNDYKENDFCQKCKYSLNKDDNFDKRRIHDFSSKNVKRGFFSNNFAKKGNIDTKFQHFRGKKRLGNRNENHFISRGNCMNSYNKRNNSREGRNFCKKPGFTFDNEKDKSRKKFNKDDFEVDLDSGDDSKDDEKEENLEPNDEKFFSSTTNNFYSGRKANSAPKEDDGDKDDIINSPENKSFNSNDKGLSFDDRNNDNNIKEENVEGGDDDFETDF